MVSRADGPSMCKKGAPTTCSDGVKNGNETAADCGGDCGARNGTACAAAFRTFKGALRAPRAPLSRACAAEALADLF